LKMHSSRNISLLLSIGFLAAFSCIALCGDDWPQDNSPPGYKRRAFEGEGPLVEVPAEIGGFAFGVASYAVGLPLIFVGDIFYFPFSGEKYFGDCIEHSYYALHTLTQTTVRMSGYYLVGGPCLLLKWIIWTGPVCFYEWTCGTSKGTEKPPPQVEPESAPPENLIEHR